jgi:hypothetical protein
MLMEGVEAFPTGGIAFKVATPPPPNQIVIEFPLAGLNRVQIKLCVPISLNDFLRIRKIIDLLEPSLTEPLPAAKKELNHEVTEGTKDE